MFGVMSADHMRRAAADTKLLRRILQRGDQLRMLRQAQVIVAAKIQQRLSIECKTRIAAL